MAVPLPPAGSDDDDFLALVALANHGATREGDMDGGSDLPFDFMGDVFAPPRSDSVTDLLTA